MAIKEFTGRSAKADEISQVLGSDAYFMRHYPKGLKERCLGPYAKDLVGVSRFYPMLEQMVPEGSEKKLPVVIDFEPTPGTGPMFLDEKRKFFMEQNIIYIPIYLTDNLSKEDFAKRYEDEREALKRGYREELEDQSLSSVDIPMFSDETLMAEVDAIALERVKALGLRGAAKIKRLAREKEAILRERMERARLDKERQRGLGSNGRTNTIPSSAR
jgi:hypothetical protein